MNGSAESPGIISLAAKDIFETQAEALTVRVSYCQIYNQIVSDLLKHGSAHDNLPLRHSRSSGEVIVVGQSWVKVHSVAEVRLGCWLCWQLGNAYFCHILLYACISLCWKSQNFALRRNAM